MPRGQQIEQNIEPPYVRQLSDDELEELLLAPTKIRVPSVTRGRQHVRQSYTTETAAAVTGTARREATKRLAL